MTGSKFKKFSFKRVFFSIYSYTIIYAIFGVLSLSYHAFFTSSLSTLEKRYHFSSSTGGLIMITDNIATVLTNLFIGYYGKTAHKPRWMSIGCLVTGLSVLLTALPYFIYGPANEADLEIVGNKTLAIHSKTNDQMCLANFVKEDCSHQSEAKMMTLVAVACFAISNFFRGFGTSIYYTYGTPYLDDNVSKAAMPVFFSAVFAARILGAPIGYFLSSVALKFNESPLSPPKDIVFGDPRWIGAWWIGFLMTGSMMILLSIPLAFFPREFKKTPSKRRQEAETGTGLTKGGEALQLVSATNPDSPATDIVPAAPSNEEQSSKDLEKNGNSDPDQDLSLKKLPGEIYAILSNPIIICPMIGNVFRGIGIIGFYVFQTRYLEAQFRQSSSKASLVSGTTGFLAKIVGVMSGGVIITLFRPGPKRLTQFIFLVEVTSVFTLLLASSIMGPQYNYPFSDRDPMTNQLQLSNQCNRDCHCDGANYQPVCEMETKNAYFSPCHAGCRKSFMDPPPSKDKTFTECGCIEDTKTKTLKVCPTDSDNLMKYAYTIALGGMISGSSRAGNMVVFFRAINPEQKSLAVAVGSFWHSLFVSIPYPIIYGRLFDWSCLVWSKECDKKGNCWLYDTERLRYFYHGLSILLIAIGSVFDFITIFLSPRLGSLYDDDEKSSVLQRIKQKALFWRKPTEAGKRESGTENRITKL